MRTESDLGVFSFLIHPKAMAAQVMASIIIT